MSAAREEAARALEGAEANDGSPLAVEEYAPCLARVMAEEVRDGCLRARDLRATTRAALEILEREGLIPGEAPELREGEALAELRTWLRGEELACYDAVRQGDEGLGVARRALTQAIQVLDRIAAKHRPSPGRLANDLQEALRLRGVDLGPDGTEAVLRALAAMEGAS